MPSAVKRVLKKITSVRFMLLGVSLPLLALSVADIGSSALRILWVLLGFSLIIFLHELGHFVVARACSVKCLAFSLGIGPRMFGWRKGAGFSFGADPFDPENKKDLAHKTLEETEGAAAVADLPQSAVAPAHPSNVGDCDYRLSWLPLGGYVRMLGQDDMDPTKISNDPRAFNRRPIWQRMCIVSAGVIMNIIFAAVTFSVIFSPSVGVDFPPAQVGYVVYNQPAYKAGLQMGDRITAIDGWHPLGGLEFTDVVISSALSSGDHTIGYDVERTLPDGSSKKLHFDVQPVRPADGGNGFLTIGVMQMPSLKIPTAKDVLKDAVSDRRKAKADGGLGDEEGAKALEQFKPGDRIVAINGHAVTDYVQMYQEVQNSGGKPVEITVVAKTDSSAPAATPRTITMRPELDRRAGVDSYPDVFGMQPRLKIDRKPEGGTPADKAGFLADDIIVRIGDNTAPDEKSFREIVKNNPGKPLAVSVLRGSETKDLTVTPKGDTGHAIIGVALGVDKENTTVLLHEETGANNDLAQLASHGNFKITAVDKTPVKNWDDILGAVKAKHPGDKIDFAFATDAPLSASAATQAAEKTVTLTVTPELADTLHEQMQYMLDLPVETLTFTQKADNSYDAVIMGMEHTKKFVLQVYMTLAGLVHGTVSPDNLHGIVGIARVGYTVQERGPVWLWYILALVSVNLAVANFLPLPIVDGGLFLLLILEKIRGRPLSLKVQQVIQTAGIVLLAGLFLYVTYNDIFGSAFGK